MPKIDLNPEELGTIRRWTEEHKRLTDLTKERRPDVFPKDKGKKLKDLVRDAASAPEGQSPHPKRWGF